MAFIKRQWTPSEADEWSKEDWITIILAPIAYILIAVGVAGTFLLLTWGFITLALAIGTTALFHWIIDPKLKKISQEYEKRQKDYLLELERSTRWEEDNG